MVEFTANAGKDWAKDQLGKVVTAWEDRSRLEQILMILVLLILLALIILIAIVATHGVNISKETEIKETDYVYSLPQGGASSSGPLSAEVIDLHSGQPARNLKVQLYVKGDFNFSELAMRHTDADGRILGFLSPGQFRTGFFYKAIFHSGSYAEQRNQAEPLVPYLEVTFRPQTQQSQLHIQVYISPNGYSTYLIA